MRGLCPVQDGLGRSWRGKKSGLHHRLFMVCWGCQLQGSSGSWQINVLIGVCTNYNGKEQKGGALDRGWEGGWHWN